MEPSKPTPTFILQIAKLVKSVANDAAARKVRADQNRAEIVERSAAKENEE